MTPWTVNSAATEIEEIIQEGGCCLDLRTAQAWKGKLEVWLRRICSACPTELGSRLKPILEDLQRLNLATFISSEYGGWNVLMPEILDQCIGLAKVAREIISGLSEDSLANMPEPQGQPLVNTTHSCDLGTRRPEPNDDSESVTSGETEPPDAHRAPVVLFEQSGEQEAPSATRQLPDLAPTPASAQTRVPLADLLREAEGRTADPKLRNKLVAVLRYNRYFEDLKVLKTVCRRYQTPALLERQFRDLDVWAALDDTDKADIASGEFDPGRFAWALVMRLINLKGKDNRTLKNYRKVLKSVGLL